MQSEIRRGRAALIYELVADGSDREVLSSQWADGPLAIEIDGLESRESTDLAWRRQQTLQRVHPLLYERPHRRHRTVSCAIETRCLTAIAAELLVFRSRPATSDASALLVVHVTLRGLVGEIVDSLGTVARHLDRPSASDTRKAIDSIVPAGYQLSAWQRRARILSFVTFGPDAVNGTEVEPSLGEWSEMDAVRWSLANASRSRSGRQPETPGIRLSLPRRQCLVAHRGVAITGSIPDSKAGFDYSQDFALTMSIYVDALLLGLVAEIGADQVSEAAASISNGAADPHAVRAVQADLRAVTGRWSEARMSVWDGSWPDQVLRSYSALSGLETQVQRATATVDSLASELQVATSERTSIMLALFALLGFIASASAVPEALGMPQYARTLAVLAAIAVVLLPAAYLGRRLMGTFSNAGPCPLRR